MTRLNGKARCCTPRFDADLLLVAAKRLVVLAGLAYLLRRAWLAYHPLSGCYCSEGRKSRAGAYIIGVVMAHARCVWQRNLTYCGPVGGSSHPAEMDILGLPPRREQSRGCTIVPTHSYRPKPHDPKPPEELSTWPTAFIQQLHKGLRVNCSGRFGGKPTVVVHLRRGDVTPSAHPSRYTSNNETIAVLRRLKLEQTHAVLVHSEKASAEAFDDLAAAGYRLALDAPLRSAWSDMLCADVLVMARSNLDVPALFRGARSARRRAWASSISRTRLGSVCCRRCRREPFVSSSTR